MDNFDLRILEALQEKGDLGPIEISSRIHLSASQCSRRMQSLRRDGYIRGIRAQLDPEKIHVGLQAYVLISMKSHAPAAAETFRKRLLDLAEVIECQTLTGAFDMIIKVATHDLKSFNRLLTDELLTSPEVSNAQSSIILEDIKSTTSLPLAFARGCG